jgi:hypothetical protein
MSVHDVGYLSVNKLLANKMNEIAQGRSSDQSAQVHQLGTIAV